MPPQHRPRRGTPCAWRFAAHVAPRLHGRQLHRDCRRNRCPATTRTTATAKAAQHRQATELPRASVAVSHAGDGWIFRLHPKTKRPRRAVLIKHRGAAVYAYVGAVVGADVSRPAVYRA